MDEHTVKNGIECRWRLKQAKTYAIIFLIIPIFVLVSAFFSTSGSTLDALSLWEVIGGSLGYTLLAYGLVFLPFIIYQLYRRQQIIKNYPKCTVHTVVLDKPHTSWVYKNSVYFTVMINGHTAVNTAPLFSDSWLSSFTLDEYSGKTVRVLYDAESQKVYLIDKL